MEPGNMEAGKFVAAQSWSFAAISNVVDVDLSGVLLPSTRAPR